MYIKNVTLNPLLTNTSLYFITTHAHEALS